MKKEFIEVEIEEGLQINHVAGIDSEGLIVELPYKLAATTTQPWPNHNWCVGCSPDVCSGCGTEPIERREQHAALNASSIQDRQDAYAAGFRRCAEWAKRDDLPHDVGSPAYLKDMAADLSVQVKTHLAAAEPVGEIVFHDGNAAADVKWRDSFSPTQNCKLYTAPPQHAARVPEDETGWLIENNGEGGELRYRFIDNDAGGVVGWTPDHAKALRFARRDDAEQFCYHDEDAWHVVEHMWCKDAAPTPPAQEDD